MSTPWRPFPAPLYCSFHTTAGYLEQALATRLQQAGGNGITSRASSPS